MKKSLLLFVCVSFISMLSDAQLIVSRKTPYNSNTYLVNSVLLGNGVIATGITYTGDDTAIGFFNGIKSALGMDSGIMLTNGAITDGPGPLWSDQPSGSPGYSWPNCTTYTDPDLAKIAGVTVTSSAILQFDFVPASDSIKFTFVFASHEYPEFVNSFNDAFGFFLSGPGIAGPFTSSAENIALIPSTGKPITINSVNYDSNCAYYVCNDYTTSTYPYASLSTCTGPCPNQHQDSVSTLGYGGYTIPITASALVQCGKQYHIKIGICNAGDCAYSSAVFIKAGSFNSSFINVSPSKSVYTCPSGSPINLVATGAGSYTWSPPTSLSCTACPNPTASPATTTTYTITGTNGPGCVDSTTVVVNVINKVTATIVGKDTVCTGTSTTLTAGGGNTFAWSTGDTTSVITVNPTIDSTYTVTATVGGCSGRDSVKVIVDSVPKVTISAVPSLSICRGSSTTLTATGGGTYLWNGTITTSSITVNPFSTTTYTLAVTNSGGCTKDTNVTVTVNPIPVISVTPSAPTICPGGQVHLTASGASTYVWTSATGLTNTTSDTTTAFPSGTTTYKVVGTSAAGCKDSTLVTVTVAGSIVAVITGKDSVCKGNSTTITASGGLTYSWAPSTGLSCTNCATTTVTPGSTTTYTVTAFTACGSAKDSIRIKVNPLPAITLSSAPSLSVCAGFSTTITATGGGTYAWSNSTSGNSIFVTPGSTTTYSLTVTNSTTGCKSDTAVTVTVNPSPIAAVTAASTICVGKDTTLTATGGGTYVWSTGATTSSITVNPGLTQSYSVMVTSVFGCKDSAYTNVTVNNPNMFVCCDTSIIKGTSVILAASGSVVAYVWTPAIDLSCFTCATPVASPTENMTYTVVGTDANGCTTEKTVTIDILCTDFKVPNVFTPNGDLYNQQFVIINETSVVLDSYTITIYDRWGKVIFTSNSFAPADSWAGKTEAGAEAPDGVYYYIINAVCGKNTYKKQGFVQLIR